MYTIKHSDGKLDISLRGRPIVAGIVPVLALDDGSVVHPGLRTESAEIGKDRLGPYTDHRFVYEDDAETLTLTLSFKVYGQGLVASASLLSLNGNRIGVRARGLAPYAGLRLEVGSLGDPDGLMANYLHKDWWSRPHFDPDITTVPPRTQSIVWHSQERYHHLLCIADEVLKTEIAGTEVGLVIATAAYDGGYCNFDTVTFALSSGQAPFDLPEWNTAAGMAALGTPFQLREHKHYPEPFEYLGWCSWDAFYREVTAEGIVAKALEFEEQGLPVRWFIVDDGWLSHIDIHLTAFEPDPDKFPGGFSPLADALKGGVGKPGHGIWWLGVWHTLFGYWNGIHPESELARTMGHALATTHSGKVVPKPDVAKAFAFWNAWHTALRNAGIDFVKVDYQSGVMTYWQQELAIGTAAKRAHEALEASVGKNFENRMINCMGMATENLWHRPTSAVTRSSDDFFPKEPKSFAEHALQNAYNAYYHTPFMWLDWDMWWTRHAYAATHAVLRAVSGGPIYVSDPVGETDPDRLWPLILSDGRLLRCDRPGVVTEDCLLRDPSREPIPLKIWSRVGEAGIVAAVNVNLDGATVEGAVSPADVPDSDAEHYVAYEIFSQQAQVVDQGDTLAVSLPPNSAALYVFLPLSEPITPIGLVDKYIAPAAIADWFAADGKTTVVLLDGGIFGWAAEAPPAEVHINGEIVEAKAGDGVYTVDCTQLSGTVWVEVIAS